jgi:hypothetical protein
MFEKIERSDYRVTKHPKTGKFEAAVWINYGLYSKVMFPDGALFREDEGQWECKEALPHHDQIHPHP